MVPGRSLRMYQVKQDRTLNIIRTSFSQERMECNS